MTGEIAGGTECGTVMCADTGRPDDGAASIGLLEAARLATQGVSAEPPEPAH